MIAQNTISRLTPLTEPRPAMFDDTLPLGDTELIVNEWHPLSDPNIYRNDGDNNDQLTKSKVEFVHNGLPAEGYVYLTYIPPKPPTRPEQRIRINLGEWNFVRLEDRARVSVAITRVQESTLERFIGNRR